MGVMELDGLTALDTRIMIVTVANDRIGCVFSPEVRHMGFAMLAVVALIAPAQFLERARQPFRRAVPFAVERTPIFLGGEFQVLARFRAGQKELRVLLLAVLNEPRDTAGHLLTAKIASRRNSISHNNIVCKLIIIIYQNGKRFTILKEK